jgi:hypothetical protein
MASAPLDASSISDRRAIDPPSLDDSDGLDLDEPSRQRRDTDESIRWRRPIRKKLSQLSTS